MTTRVATALSGGTAVEAAKNLAAELQKQLGGQEAAFALVFASTAQPLAELAPALQAHLGKTVLLGASTAGEFTEKGDAKQSACVVAVAGDFKVSAGLGEGLTADPERAVDASLKGVAREEKGYPFRTVLMLLDPLTGRGEEATLLAALKLGAGARLAGGAAGDDLKMSATHVSLGGKARGDALVMATVFSKKPLGVGVQHGHQSISRPLKVTRASGAVVAQVEGRPAWDVWVEHTREVAKRSGIDPTALSPDAVGAYLLRFEAGLAAGSALKIRAPLSKSPDGALHFACGIPEGAEIQITESEPDRQIASARTAARLAHQQIGGAPLAGAIVFDCICRNLILGNRFKEAVAGIHAELGNIPLAGFETYGEIALDAGDLSGFHNTTTVVLAIPQD